MPRRYDMVIPFAILFVLASLFFSPFLIHGQVFFPGDILEDVYPWKYFAPVGSQPHNRLLSDPVNYYYAPSYNVQLHEGSLDLWNPYILTGSPAAVSGLMGYPGRFYPPKLILHYLMDTAHATTALLYLHVILMGCFMYLYLRQIGTSQGGSLFGAVAYMFNACAMVWLESECWVYVFALLPLLLLFFEKYFAGRHLAYAFLAGGTFGLIILSGHHHLNTYVSLIIFAYFLFMLKRARGALRKNGSMLSICILLLITGMIGLSIGAIELLPIMEAISQSSRSGDVYSFSGLFEKLGRLPLRYLVTLVFPDFFGSPVSDIRFFVPPALPEQVYMNYTELCIYMGVPTLFAFLGALLGPKNQFSRFYLAMTVLVVLMIAGTFVYYPIFTLVPGMDKVNPLRMIFLFVFGFSVVAGQGMGEISGLPKPRRNLFIAIALVSLSLIVLVSLFASDPQLSAWFNKEQFRPLKYENLPFLTELARIREFTSPVIHKPLILAVLSVLLCILLSVVRRGRAAVLITAALIALVAYDLGSFGRRYNTTVPPEDIYWPTPGIEYLMHQEGPFRITQPYWNRNSANTFAPFGIEDLGGYSSYLPRRTNELLSLMQIGERTQLLGLKFDRWVMLENVSSPLLDLLNVRYAVLPPGGQVNDPRFTRVYSRDLTIYENRRVMPRLFGVYRHRVIADPQGILRYMTSGAYEMRSEVILEAPPPDAFLRGIRPLSTPPSITIERYSPDEITVSADFPSNGWLVVTDAFFPGWEARVDGRQTQILRANFNFRAIECPEGQHTVTLSYRPAGVRWGAVITGVGVFGAVLGMIVSITVRRPFSKGNEG